MKGLAHDEEAVRSAWKEIRTWEKQSATAIRKYVKALNAQNAKDPKTQTPKPITAPTTAPAQLRERSAAPSENGVTCSATVPEAASDNAKEIHSKISELQSLLEKRDEEILKLRREVGRLTERCERLNDQAEEQWVSGVIIDID